MCMFGFNAGGGSYLPRQGSFVIQPLGTFFGLTDEAIDAPLHELAAARTAHQVAPADFTALDFGETRLLRLSPLPSAPVRG